MQGLYGTDLYGTVADVSDQYTSGRINNAPYRPLICLNLQIYIELIKNKRVNIRRLFAVKV